MQRRNVQFGAIRNLKLRNWNLVRAETCWLGRGVKGDFFAYGGIMDKKLVGLLGAAAALTTLTAAQAAPVSGSEPPQATSYRDLLDPIPNAVPLLKADDARLAQTGGVRTAEVVVGSPPSSSRRHRSGGTAVPPASSPSSSPPSSSRILIRSIGHPIRVPNRFWPRAALPAAF
jgi:hypothetical protein